MMWEWRRGSGVVVLFVSSLLAGSLAGSAAAPWRSPLQGLTMVKVEKKARPDVAPPCAGCALTGAEALDNLPADVLQAAGAHRVEYESFLLTYLPAPAAQALVEVARGHDLAAGAGDEREIHLPWHTFLPGAKDGRDDPRVTSVLPPAAVPGMYLVQWAYPVLPDWATALEACGAHQIAWFQTRTSLVRAADATVITGCPAAKYLAWVEPYRVSDRIAPELLTTPNPLGYWLQYPAFTDLQAKAKILPSGFIVDDVWETKQQDPVSYLIVRANVADLAHLVATDPDLLTVSARAEAAPSDERQGQIIAGNHGATSVCVPLTGCPYPRYKNWLTSKGALTSSNQQTVAIIDVSGYDDGGAPTPGVIDHHPDMESPERLDAICGGTYSATCNPASSSFGDEYDHPTMIAGIIAGDGSVAGATGGVDSVGYYNGMGIAPGAKIFSYKLYGDLRNLSAEQVALSYSRNKMEGDQSDRALIANNSWNEFNLTNNVYSPEPRYTAIAQFYDAAVRDANSQIPLSQLMTMVFSAGNYAYECNSGTISWDSVSSPAVAKNVIAVGATQSYRPSSSGPPLACRGCFNADGGVNGRPPDEDATDINSVARFSGRGRYFGPYPNASRSTNTRIKPDLVAPGVRVFSTVPYNYSPYNTNTLFNACSKYYPDPPTTYHSYGTGTSFAAPVVSGSAAIVRKWLKDQSLGAPPSLVKAILTGIADDMATAANGYDHRPSPLYGWGRVALQKLFDGVTKTVKPADATNRVIPGSSILYSLHVASSTAPVLITLVWDDPPSTTTSNSQEPLVNDLAVSVDNGLYQGNFFNETMTGVDNGWSYRFNVGTAGNDSINNVEAVFIPAGTYTQGAALQIKVTAINMAAGQTEQTFSLFAYNVY